MAYDTEQRNVLWPLWLWYSAPNGTQMGSLYNLCTKTVTLSHTISLWYRTSKEQHLSAASDVKVSLWCHQMKHFLRYWPFVRGIHQSPVDCPHKGQWSGALMFFLSLTDQTVEKAIETPVIWDATVIIMTPLECCVITTVGFRCTLYGMRPNHYIWYQM